MLFDELKLPVVKTTTKTGPQHRRRGAADARRSDESPVPRLVSEYRELVKLKGTYIDTLPTHDLRRDRPDPHQFQPDRRDHRAAELERSEPAEHSDPHRTRAARSAGRLWPATPITCWSTADYSQIELRVLAHYCRTKRCAEAFAEDMDIHAFVAAQVFGVPLEQVSKEQRGRAKAVNFGIIYGQTAFGLSKATRHEPDARRRASSTCISCGIRASARSSTRAWPTRADSGTCETILGRRRSRPRHQLPQPQPAFRRRALRRQHGHPGQRRRPDQAGHDRDPPPHHRREPPVADDHPGPRRTGVRRPARRR